MRTTILSVFIISFFSSCSHYQYITLASENVSSNDNNEFVAENDTLKITYNFYGKNGPINIAIYNKSALPLQIDWKRSSLIFGDKPVAFYQSDLNINATITRPAYSREQSLDGTIERQPGIEFIPPHSVVNRSGLFVGRKFDMKSYQAKEEKIKAKGFYSKLTKATFEKTNSPMNFRSYITFISDANPAQSFAVEHSFYLSELIETKLEPAYVWPEKTGKGNKFYMDMSTSPGSVIGVLIGAAVVTAVLVTGTQESTTL